MFYNCTLESIDLSSFDTSKVTLMNHMFYNCTFLKSLNLSNIDTHLVKDMEFMFYNCKNLEYINFINAKEYTGFYYYNMFDGVPENIVYCINEINAPIISSILKQKQCSIKYCAENWKDKQKQMFLMNNKYQCEEITLTSSYESDLISTNYLNNITEITGFTSSNNIIETTYLFNENKSDLNSISENIDISYKRTDLIITQYINYIDLQNNTIETTYLIDDSISYISSLNELIDNTYKTDYNNNLTNIFDITDDNNCTVNFGYINEDLNSSIISRYINNYINKKSNSYINSSVNHYINNNLNFTITIFNA
jgi:surface protein